MQMDRAERDVDRAAFFAAARTALQARLAAAWHTTPEAITAHDVAARLGDDGAAIRRVFEHADRVTYAGDLSTAEPLEHRRPGVRGALVHLETSS